MDLSSTDFHVTVHVEADSLWAEVAELPGCFAEGATEEELWEALTEAVSLYLSDADEHLEFQIKDVTPVTNVRTFETRLVAV